MSRRPQITTDVVNAPHPATRNRPCPGLLRGKGTCLVIEPTPSVDLCPMCSRIPVLPVRPSPATFAPRLSSLSGPPGPFPGSDPHGHRAPGSRGLRRFPVPPARSLLGPLASGESCRQASTLSLGEDDPNRGSCIWGSARASTDDEATRCSHTGDRCADTGPPVPHVLVRVLA